MLLPPAAPCQQPRITLRVHERRGRGASRIGRTIRGTSGRCTPIRGRTHGWAPPFVDTRTRLPGLRTAARTLPIARSRGHCMSAIDHHARRAVHRPWMTTRRPESVCDLLSAVTPRCSWGRLRRSRIVRRGSTSPYRSRAPAVTLSGPCRLMDRSSAGERAHPAIRSLPVGSTVLQTFPP